MTNNVICNDYLNSLDLKNVSNNMDFEERTVRHPNQIYSSGELGNIVTKKKKNNKMMMKNVDSFPGSHLL